MAVQFRFRTNVFSPTQTANILQHAQRETEKKVNEWVKNRTQIKLKMSEMNAIDLSDGKKFRIVGQSMMNIRASYALLLLSHITIKLLSWRQSFANWMFAQIQDDHHFHLPFKKAIKSNPVPLFRFSSSFVASFAHFAPFNCVHWSIQPSKHVIASMRMQMEISMLHVPHCAIETYWLCCN